MFHSLLLSEKVLAGNISLLSLCPSDQGAHQKYFSLCSWVIEILAINVSLLSLCPSDKGAMIRSLLMRDQGTRWKCFSSIPVSE